MNIEYLKKTEDWIRKNDPNLFSKVPEAKILELESKWDVSFPKAYKELLYLSGEDFEPFLNINFGVEWSEENIWPNEKEWLSDADIILKKPYWIFGEDQGVIYFFYLDEGEDPPVWVCEIEMKRQEGYEWLGKGADSFSSFVNGHIDYYEKNKKYLR